MSAPALLEELRANDVQIIAEGNRLHYDGPSNVLTPKVLAAIAAKKPELLSLLAQSTLVFQPSRGFRLSAAELPEYQAAVDALDNGRETPQQHAVMSLPERYPNPKGAA